MKAGFTILVVLALGALAANYLLTDNGYVLINFWGYVIEMSLPVLVFLLVLTYAAVRACIRIWQAPKRLGEAVAQRRMRKASERITQGYIEIGQGNYARGEKLLTKGARSSETPLLNYLAAARAAQAQGDTERRDRWLGMAGEQEPRARATVLITKAQLQLESGDMDAARETLTEVLEISAHNSEALRMQAEISLANEDWAALESALPALRKAGKVPAKTLDDWTVQAWTAQFQAAGEDKARGKALWKALPKHLRANPILIEARARALMAAGESRQAEALLRSSLKRSWHDALVIAYGELDVPDATSRLRRVEGWLKDHPEDPVLLMVAARLCVATELWGKARSYYESSVARQPAPRTWHELGQLLLQMGEQEQAYEAFQKGLTQSYSGAALLRLPNAGEAGLGDQPAPPRR